MKNFIFGMLAVILVAGVGFAAYQYGKNSGQTVSASRIPTVTPSVETVVSPTQPLVGNDSDEHGCKGSAGYTWCAEKNKCLRIWEEPCQQENDNDLIKQALFKKNNWKESDGITVTVSSNDGKYAKGGVTAQGGGGYFFAAKVNGVWEIVADGNGVILCSALEKYPDYPKTFIPECWDDVKKINVTR